MSSHDIHRKDADREQAYREVVQRHGGSSSVAAELATYEAQRFAGVNVAEGAGGIASEGGAAGGVAAGGVAAGGVAAGGVAAGAASFLQLTRDESQGKPLDEPHVQVWREFAEGARSRGSLAVLREAFPQLRFPILRGLSETPMYRAAIRRGESPQGASSRLELHGADRLEITFQQTAAGVLPVLVAPVREDFEALVRVFTARNEPVEVPGSMGACLVSGVVNWQRVQRYRKAWEAKQPSTFLLHAGWELEMGRLRSNKALYQDRFLLLSHGPYSGLDGSVTGMEEQAWLQSSIALRREHEAAHYVLMRAYPGLVPQVVDEILADLAALVAVFGEYRVELALRFLGLEDFPDYRAGGRLENYLGETPLSDRAFEILQGLVFEAIVALGRQCEAEAEILREPALRARRIIEWAALGIHELGGGFLTA